MGVGMQCKECPVRKSGICSYASECELENLEKNRTLKSYKNLNVIFSSSGKKEFFGSIVSGSMVIGLGRSATDLRSRKIALPSHLLIVDKGISACYRVAACEYVTICSLDVEFISNEILSASSGIRFGVVDFITNELKNEFERSAIREKLSSERRVRIFIAFMIKHFAHKMQDQGFIDMPISRIQWAEIIGVTVETLSRELAKLRKKDLISTHGHRQLMVNKLSEFVDNDQLVSKNIFESSCTVI